MISSEVLRKKQIVIPAKERRQVRLLGVQGQATIQDKVVIVFELFGNRVGIDGKERASFSVKDSFLLQVEAIIVDDPNVTMLLGISVSCSVWTYHDDDTAAWSEHTHLSGHNNLYNWIFER